MSFELLDSDITKFKKLYKEKFNIEINNHEAREKLTLLVRQMEIVYQPITKAQLEDLIIKDTRKQDAKALAELIYDIYQDENGKDAKQSDR